MEGFLESGDIYQHTVLPEGPSHPAQIRLLQVDRSDPDILQGSLQPFSLEPIGHLCPPFIALSYTWGPPERLDSRTDEAKSYYIVIDGRPMQVNTNLYRGLQEVTKYLHDHSRPTQYLWVDAICINQNNFAEKGQQVDMMGTIYRRAESVFVWLGDGPIPVVKEVKSMVVKVTSLVRDAQRKVKNFDEVGYWQSLSEFQRRQEFEYYGLPMRGSLQWVYFWQFFSRRWFSRIWAIQEFVLASRVDYLCGSIQFSLDELLMSADLLYWEIRTWPELISPTSDYDLITSMRNVFVIEDLYSEGGRFTYYDRVALVGPQTRSRESPWAFLLNLLYSSRRHQATIEKDKVYALLGLVRTKAGLSSVALQGFIKADYAKLTNETFLEVVQGIISDTRWLGTLVLVENRSSLDHPELPSYVPNFAKRGDQFGLGWQVFEKVLPQLEGISSRAPQSGLPTFHRDVLGVHVIYIETVTLTSEPFVDLFDFNTDFKNGAAIIEAIGRLPLPASQTAVEISWRAFIAGDKRAHSTVDLALSFSCFCLHRLLQYQKTSKTSTEPLNDISHFALAKTLLNYGAQDHSSFLTQYLQPQIHEDNVLLEKLFQEAKAFESIFSCHYLDRSLFQTDQGSLGTCYSTVRPGDQVWFLACAPCPFVLRKVAGNLSQNRFRLVGWSYLQGFPRAGNLYSNWVNVEIE